jgi:tyrosyl-tRNA synthetase
VGITEPPEEIFGKVMSISDTLMYRWYELLTGEGADGASRLAASAASGEAHPRDLKVRLASELVTRFHGASAAQAAAARFQRVFAGHEVPDDVPSVTLPAEGDPPSIVELLHETGLASSRSEARRLVRQGGIRIDGRRVEDETAAVERRGERLLQVGRRRFLSIRFA